MRVGRVLFSDAVIRESPPEILVEMTRGMFVLDIHRNFATAESVYTMLSEEFPLVEEGKIIPEYSIVWNERTLERKIIPLGG